MRRLFLAIGLCVSAQGAIATEAPPPLDPCRTGAQRLSRVELFFGVPASATRGWRRFLANTVTRRFPAGLTVIEAKGQWRGAHGLDHEASRVVTIIYRRDDDSDAKIEAIRTAYKTVFKQQSVLRVDTLVCASF